MRVRVDFSGRAMTAFVRRVHGETPADFDPKDLVEAVDPAPIFDTRLLDLCGRISSDYLSSVGEALSMALPSGLKPSFRFKTLPDPSGPGIILNEEQSAVYGAIMRGVSGGDPYHLIFGITGSGKTEVYMELARSVIAAGKSVIYLVPEISISSQIFERLGRVFGSQLLVYHSHLTPNQRLGSWMRFYSGEAKIAVGTRSAVFLQCPDLGLVIIDEENDGSYKEHSTPRYNARRVAVYRCRDEGAALVMGSATPSIETLHSAESGVFRLHRLTGRYGGARLPEIEVVKMKSSRPSDLITPTLKLATKKAMENGKQAIYLLNRRGFSPLVLCGDCREAVSCPNCSISMNLHRDGMLCHYCGLRRPFPRVCDKCGSREMHRIGTGTQRMEDLLDMNFPGVRSFRLDQDSSRKKGSVPDLIEKMKEGEIDILLGTQMVAKGFDFGNVTVVGVIMADIGLKMPDFRSSERVFALLMQVAGRSGRRESPGRVIIQTMNDDQEIFRFIRDHDYYGFYRHELELRRAMEYPPFVRMARLLVRGRDDARVSEGISRLAEAVREAAGTSGADVKMLGPSSAPFTKIGGNYRHHIILKSKNTDDLKSVITRSRGSMTFRDLYLEIDMDPYEIM
jgi:primosomal protein N' (replication factor Y)